MALTMSANTVVVATTRSASDAGACEAVPGEHAASTKGDHRQHGEERPRTDIQSRCRSCVGHVGLLRAGSTRRTCSPDRPRTARAGGRRCGSRSDVRCHGRRLASGVVDVATRAAVRAHDMVVVRSLAGDVGVVARGQVEPLHRLEIHQDVKCAEVVARPISRCRARASATRSAAVKWPLRAAIRPSSDAPRSGDSRPRPARGLRSSRSSCEMILSLSNRVHRHHDGYRAARDHRPTGNRTGPSQTERVMTIDALHGPLERGRDSSPESARSDSPTRTSSCARDAPGRWPWVYHAAPGAGRAWWQASRS